MTIDDEHPTESSVPPAYPAYPPHMYGPPPGYGYPPPQVMYVAPAATNGLATGAMVTGIASIPLACICIGPVVGVLAVVFGIIALLKSKELAGLGRTYSIVGIATGAVGIVALPIMYLVLGTGGMLFNPGTTP